MSELAERRLQHCARTKETDDIAKDVISSKIGLLSRVRELAQGRLRLRQRLIRGLVEGFVAMTPTACQVADSLVMSAISVERRVACE